MCISVSLHQENENHHQPVEYKLNRNVFARHVIRDVFYGAMQSVRYFRRRMRSNAILLIFIIMFMRLYNYLY